MFASSLEQWTSKSCSERDAEEAMLGGNDMDDRSSGIEAPAGVFLRRAGRLLAIGILSVTALFLASREYFPDPLSRKSSILGSERGQGTGIEQLVEIVDVPETEANQEFNSAWHHFEGRQYILINALAPWEEQRKNCESMGAHMVSINSEAENSFVVSLMPPQSAERWEWLWIGMKQVTLDSWIDGSSMSFKKWAPDQPSTTNIHQACGEIYRPTGDNWHDNECAEKSRTVCEKEQQSAASELTPPQENAPRTAEETDLSAGTGLQWMHATKPSSADFPHASADMIMPDSEAEDAGDGIRIRWRQHPHLCLGVFFSTADQHRVGKFNGAELMLVHCDTTLLPPRELRFILPPDGKVGGRIRWAAKPDMCLDAEPHLQLWACSMISAQNDRWLVNPAGDGQIVWKQNPFHCVIVDPPVPKAGTRLKRGSCQSRAAFLLFRGDEGIRLRMKDHPGKCLGSSGTSGGSYLHVMDCESSSASSNDMKFSLPVGEAPGPMLWLAKPSMCVDKPKGDAALQLWKCEDAPDSHTNWVLTGDEAAPKIQLASEPGKCIAIDRGRGSCQNSQFGACALNGRRLILVDCNEPSVFVLDHGTTTGTTTAMSTVTTTATYTFTTTLTTVTTTSATTTATDTTSFPLIHHDLGPFHVNVPLTFPLTFDGESVGGCPKGWVCSGQDTRICNVPALTLACNHPGMNEPRGTRYLLIGNDFSVGNATSSAFVLPHGIDRIRFRRSGGADAGSGLYVRRASDNAVLCAAESKDEPDSNVFHNDSCTGLARYAGEQVYIFIADTQESPWGKVLVKDIRIVNAAGTDIDIRPGASPDGAASESAWSAR